MLSQAKSQALTPKVGERRGNESVEISRDLLVLACLLDNESASAIVHRCTGIIVGSTGVGAPCSPRAKRLMCSIVKTDEISRKPVKKLPRGSFKTQYRRKGPRTLCST
jgi:hypothetical protein